MNKRFQANKLLYEKINSIPKKNMTKFARDLIFLIEKAHEEDYENFEIS